MKTVDDIMKQLTTALDEAGRSYHRLVLLIGPSDSGKTQLLRQLADERVVAIPLEPFYMEEDAWVWFDDVEIVKLY